MNANAAFDIDFDYPDGPDSEAMPPVVVADQDQAEAHLRTLAYWRYQAEQIEAHAQRQIERAQAWRDAELKKLAPRIGYHESGLVAYIQAQGKKTMRLINGTLKRIAGRDRVEIKSENELAAWCKTSGIDLLRIKVEGDKTAIAQHVKTTGELPDGVEIVTGEDTFKVETD